jgi:hypothetical protein
MMKTLALSLFGLLALGTVACGGPHYSTHTIDNSVSPTGGTITLSKVTVPLGGAVKAHIVAYNSDHKRMGGGVESDNASVVGVSNVVTGDDDWVFLGVTAGTTVVHLMADGVVVRDIQAEVVDVQDVSHAP